MVHAARERLPNRRLAETFDLEVAGLRYTCTVGRFPDGSIAELFLSNHRSNSGRQKALQLFPAAHAALARKKDHGRAEASLIALFGVQQ